MLMYQTSVAKNIYVKIQDHVQAQITKYSSSTNPVKDLSKSLITTHIMIDPTSKPTISLE